MKNTHSISPQYVVRIIIYSVLAVSIVACDKKPKEVATQVEEIVQQPSDMTPAVRAKLEIVELTLPKCEGPQCPKISIQRLSSNYPEIDDRVDHFIENYVQTLVQGFDIPSKNSTEHQEQNNLQEANTPITEIHAQQVQQPVDNQEQQNTQPQQVGKLQQAIDEFVVLANEVKSLGSSSQLSLLVKPQLLNPKGPVVTVVIDANNYVGGAHGSATQQYLNFDLNHKNILSLEQIINKGQRTQFNELAYQAFLQWVKETQPDTDLTVYQQLWKFDVSENFYLSPNGLILQYGEYEIGPYAVGLPRLIIPYDKLKDILKLEYLPIITQGKTVESKAHQHDKVDNKT